MSLCIEDFRQYPWLFDQASKEVYFYAGDENLPIWFGDECWSEEVDFNISNIVQFRDIILVPVAGNGINIYSSNKRIFGEKILRCNKRFKDIPDRILIGI